jgi:LA2681-like HEPN
MVCPEGYRRSRCPAWGCCSAFEKRSRESTKNTRTRRCASLQHALEFLESGTTGGDPPDLSAANDYQRFVAKHWLALAPTTEGLDLAMPRWDSLRVESISEPMATEHGVPPLFAMFNVLKSEYLTARFLAYSALSGKIPESGNYSDTLDYTCYGIRTSLLRLSQQLVMDYWRLYGERLTHYRDIAQHHTFVASNSRLFRGEDGRLGIFLLLPSNPEVKDASKLVFGNSHVHAQRFLREQFKHLLAMSCWITRVLLNALPGESRQQVGFYPREELEVGAQLDGHCPMSAEELDADIQQILNRIHNLPLPQLVM